MNFQNLSPVAMVIIAAIVVMAVVLIAVFIRRRRTEKLRARFGPEYERSVVESGSQRRAEVQLEKRAERVEKFHLRPLSSGDRERFTGEWNHVQAHFVDAPAGAVGEADQLLGDIMATRGYPMGGDFEQRAADISVDHPIVTQNYRAAHEIAIRQTKGQASTEDLRRAMIHYRTLFEDLVTVPTETASRKTVVVEDGGFKQEELRARRG